MRKTTLVLLLVLGMLLMVGVVGCGPADGSGAQVVEDEAESTEPDADEPADEPADESAPGTRQNPLPLGTTAQIDDWEVKVTDVNLDADDVIVDANMFNDPPTDGSRFVLIVVEGKYTGDDSGDFAWDMSYKFLGAGGNTFGSGDAMAVPPNPVYDAGETFPGASISGDLLFEVPVDQIDGGALIVQALLAGDTRVFFAVD